MKLHAKIYSNRPNGYGDMMHLILHFSKIYMFFVKTQKMGQNRKLQKFLKNLPGECCNEATCKKLCQSAQWLRRYDVPKLASGQEEEGEEEEFVLDAKMAIFKQS